jgi:hypothetical protein
MLTPEIKEKAVTFEIYTKEKYRKITMNADGWNEWVWEIPEANREMPLLPVTLYAHRDNCEYPIILN